MRDTEWILALGSDKTEKFKLDTDLSALILDSICHTNSL